MEVATLTAEKCRRVWCECSEPNYCDGWKTCADRDLPLDEFCPPCLARVAQQEVTND